MIIRHPGRSDWDEFFALASAEGWRVPQSERQLFLGNWSHYAHLLDDDGFCGLVTAVPHEKSAWIGNLLVPQGLRGRGYGRHLFRAAVNDCLKRGMVSIWLTASQQGLRIYEREGFTTVDHVERWVLSPSRGVGPSETARHGSCEELLCLDARVWGESRHTLLSALCQKGKVVTFAGSTALLQQGADLQIIGPWIAGEDTLPQSPEVLHSILAFCDPAVEVVIDSLSSSGVQPLLETAGFQYVGKTALMVYGDFSRVSLKRLVSLASLGSMG